MLFRPVLNQCVDFIKINLQIAAIKGKPGGACQGIDAGQAVVCEIIGEQRPLFRVDDPVFPDTGIAVFLEFFDAVLSPGRK